MQASANPPLAHWNCLTPRVSGCDLSRVSTFREGEEGSGGPKMDGQISFLFHTLRSGCISAFPTGNQKSSFPSRAQVPTERCVMDLGKSDRSKQGIKIYALGDVKTYCAFRLDTYPGTQPSAPYSTKSSEKVNRPDNWLPVSS